MAALKSGGSSGELLQSGVRYTFVSATGSRFELDMGHPDNAAGRLAIRETRSGRYPVAGGGLYYMTDDGDIVEPRFVGQFGDVDSVSHERIGLDTVRITVAELLEGEQHRKRYTLRLLGGALEIAAESLDGRGDGGTYVGFSLGDIEGTRDGVSVRVPYMDALPITLLDHSWFVSAWLDPARSKAQLFQPRGPQATTGGFVNDTVAFYLPASDGRVDPISEIGYVTVSRDVEDVFAVPQNPPSPHRSRLSDRALVVVEGSSFDATVAAVARFEELGGKALLMAVKDWREPGSSPPRPGPPADSLGGGAGWEALLAELPIAPAWDVTRTSTGCPGQRNPLYDPDEVVRAADLRMKLWLEGSTACASGGSVGHELLGPEAALRHLANQSPGAGAQGVFLDTFPTWHPGYPFPGADETVIDRDVRSDRAGSVGEAIAAYKSALALAQRRFGPVVVKGATGVWERAFDSFYAGYVDGIERSLVTGSETGLGADYLVAPDYELRVFRPRAVGYGMGDYSDFFDLPSLELPLNDGALDEWRATALSYGHGPALYLSQSESYLTAAEMIKEYVWLRAVARRALTAGSEVEIAYVQSDGAERDLSWVLQNDAELSTPRLHISYPNGLELWVNHRADAWPINMRGLELRLPENGWAVVDSDGLLGYSALQEGRRVDFLDSREVTLVDGRGVETRFGAIAARDLRIEYADGTIVEERPDGTLDIR